MKTLNHEVKILYTFVFNSGKTVMESTESRFAHLLQPIRELTKNWEIDVASELNDYLEEVSYAQNDCLSIKICIACLLLYTLLNKKQEGFILRP